MLMGVLTGWAVGITIVTLFLAYRLGKVENSYRWRIETLESSLSVLSMDHDKTIQATRTTDDRFIELAEKIENIDEDVLDGTVCRQFIENEVRKAFGESYTSNINGLENSIKNLEENMKILASAFRCLGSDLE